MRAAFVSIATIVIAFSCAPHVARIRGDHAREFGCEQRWVEVQEVAEGDYRAIGCGFQSEWTCRDRQCRMRDHRAYGVDAP